MSVNNSKPAKAPVVVLHEAPSDTGRQILRLLPAMLGSVVFHAVLLGGFFLYMQTQQAFAGDDQPKTEDTSSNNINADQSEDQKKETFNVIDVDPAAVEFDTDIQYAENRIAEASVPGTVNPNEAVGIHEGDKNAAMMNIAAPGGFGGQGQGGAIESFTGPGNSNMIGEAGGFGPKNLPLQGSFYGRSGATRENALRNGGGTTESEAAVAKGLRWIVRQQMPDGKWMLNSPTLPDRDRGSESNDIAATALGLLPLLAAGKTQKPGKDNPFDKNIDKGLKFLIRSQDKNGFYGVSMYAHGLAAITMCEAYGLSQDPVLRRPAQAGITLLVNTQHEGGGWRYGPAKQPGDLSVVGWQIMALKSGQMAGLDVPAVTIRKAISYLDSCCGSDEGYGYTGPGNSPRLTAVGLLGRQYLQNWGPSHPRMIKGVANYLQKNPPGAQDVYYYYYATQVMHHFGGQEWREWNDKMRDYLIKKQDNKESSANFGSWAPQGDAFGGVGGRLMLTSLNLLTLEVYYRYLPLYQRDAGYGKEMTKK